MEQRITLITLGVSDVQRSKFFYNDHFGWTPADSSNESIIFYTLNGITLALFNETALAEDATVSPARNGFRKFSLAYNVRSEKEVDDLINTLDAKGVQIVKRPEKVFWGGYSSYFADPDGILWEVAYNPYLLP